MSLSSVRAAVSSLFRRQTPRVIQGKSETATNLIWPIRKIRGGVEVEGEFNMVVCEIGYIDTMDKLYENVSREKLKKAKTVLFLGNEHFMDNPRMQMALQSNLFKPLSENNCRVIAPFGLVSKHTGRKELVHNQMLGGRTKFILDFLFQNRITDIDLVIGHSMASFMAITLKLCWNKVKSLAIINPIPGNDSPRWVRPASFSFKMMESYNKPFPNLPFFLLSKLWLRRVRRLMGSELMGSEFTDWEAYQLARVTHGLNFNSIQSMAISVDTLSSPFLQIDCRGDPVINWKDAKEYYNLIGSKEEEIFEYDNNYKVQRSDPLTPPKMKSIRLPCHTHFPFQDINSSKIIVEELLKLMDNYDTNYAHKKI